MQFKDYYQVLGITKTASASEIKTAYRKLARKYHPDVNPGDASAETKFKELNEAHEVIGDPDTRRKYDELGANWKQYENVPAGGGRPPGSGGPFAGFRGARSGGVRWNAGGAPGAQQVSEDELRDMFGDAPFSDFFETFFAGSGSHPGSGPHRPTGRARDVEHPISLSLEQAFGGVAQRLSIRPAQGGSPRTVDVRIPAGVTEGSRVRVAGEGEPGPQGVRGDLYLRVHLDSHPVFERKGQDLYVKAAIPVTTAVLGGEVDLPTLDGTSVRLKIPSATQPGQVMRLKGKGMPGHGRHKARGDLYATVQVKLPDHLSPKARTHYEALAELDSAATGPKTHAKANEEAASRVNTEDKT